MFEDNYKKAFDEIKPDDALKNDILDKIKAIEEKKSVRNPAMPWRIGFAAAACVAIVLSVIFIPKPNIKTQVSAQTLSVADSYSEIYKILKKANKKSIFFNGAGDMAIEDDMAIEYEYEMLDGADSEENTTATGGSAKEESTSDIANDYSETTQQVEGVSEADIIKTDGEYIYALFEDRLEVIKANGENTVHIATEKIENKSYYNIGEMFLFGDRLILISQGFYDDNGNNYCSAIIFDISNPAEIKQTDICKQKGNYLDSRMIGKYVYLITDCNIQTEIIKEKVETYVPTIICEDIEKPVPADSIYRYGDDEKFPEYTVISAFDCENGKMSSTASILGGTENIYCSKQNIITANTVYGEAEPEEFDVPFPSNTTTVSRLAIKDGKIEYKASGSINGYLDDQFFIDEHNGYFRFVTTVDYAVKSESRFANTDESIVTYTNERCAELTVLDGELKPTGAIKDLAKGEKVYSVRFMGDTAYFVTFRQTDPLFSADLTDPNNPKIIGELKIPGFSEYLYPYGNGKLLGFGYDADEKTGRTKDLKLSMFDISDPANVTENDKTIVDGLNYSPALYDHKAMLVSPTKNLMGFAAVSAKDTCYAVYEYADGGFIQKAKLIIPVIDSQNPEYTDITSTTRGLFIGDNFYIINAQGIYCYNLSDFALLTAINF